jgi:glycosyltransferase involved in cell wall biosynthesis
MPSVLIVCAHRQKRSPSQRYRFEQYLSFLEQKGFKFTYSFLLNEKDDRLFYSQGNFPAKVIILFKSVLIRIKDSFRFKRFDIIFIQREASFFGTSFFEKRAFKSGASVIFDFDDSIWLADTSPGNKKWEWIKAPKKFFKNISYAHVVIAGNSYLAEKAKPVNSNTVIIPTTIDTQFHVPKPELRNHGSIVIGWSGSISTVKHFELLIPVLIKVKERFKEKVKFKILGHSNYFNPELDTTSLAWKEDIEVNELNSFDIGIMPLPDDEWAGGKCGLKGLSYMACEVPTVMSGFGVNKQIISSGVNGFLANSDAEWYEILCKLVEDKEMRKEIGAKGRETVIENYSVKANSEKYLKVFTDAKQC